MAKPKAAAAVPAAAKSETVKEYVLYRVQGEGREPLFSDSDAELVHSVRRDALKRAIATGAERPQLVVTCRRCVFPLSDDGKRLALGSTCDETEV